MTTTVYNAFVAAADANLFRAAYRGRAGACCCGCAGTHRTIEENSRFVAQVISTIRRYPASIEDNGDGCYSADIGDKTFIVYTNP